MNYFGYFWQSLFITIPNYSRLLNKRVGWNKHVGGKKLGNTINVVVGINMLVGKSNKVRLFPDMLRDFFLKSNEKLLL